MGHAGLGPASLQVARAVSDALGRALAAPFPHGRSGRAQAGPRSVVVAVSGGADSLALAAGTVWALRPGGPFAQLPAWAVVVDHGLQDGSAEVAERAAAQARDLGLESRVVRVAPDGRDGPEASARRARYAALLAERSAHVLLGHTLDDQAETVLLGLARGSGTRSLAGMAERSGRLVRPLLGLRRAVTSAACAEAGLRPWVDPHNTDPGFARPRVRSALPLLDALLGPGLPEPRPHGDTGPRRRRLPRPDRRRGGGGSPSRRHAGRRRAASLPEPSVPGCCCRGCGHAGRRTCRWFTSALSTAW
jgi:tRNA(Ile)-lysidine synthetase-like protein